MNKKGKFFIFCMIFVANTAFAQQLSLQPASTKGFSKIYPAPFSTTFYHDGEKAGVSPKFYVNNLGFFCKQELKLQAVTKLPLFFRLGSLQYCDRMEGKINAGARAAY